jgi:hypothetical protein
VPNELPLVSVSATVKVDIIDEGTEESAEAE